MLSPDDRKKLHRIIDEPAEHQDRAAARIVSQANAEDRYSRALWRARWSGFAGGVAAGVLLVCVSAFIIGVVAFP